ncbi:hypothetical protein LBMAG42_37970 [Deltaproteobacteria bacterium]|nr:hypothetical protein LBMAG42_37970 [Deltaproteobacteria bacterium]
MLVLAVLGAWPRSGEKDTGLDGAPPPPSAVGGVAAGVVGLVDASACGGTVPEERSFHQASWFFVDQSTKEMGTGASARYVQRGFLLFGGESLSTGDILDDAWVFDTTNLGTGKCPWIELPATGRPRMAGGMGWDPSADEFVQVGGYTSNGATTYAVDTVLRASLADLLDGTGWTAAAVLPEREYATSRLSDTTGTGNSPYPSLDCNVTERRDVACVEDATWADLAASSGGTAESGFCDGAGQFDEGTWVLDFVDVSPCDATGTCTNEDGFATTSSTPYTDACADDPQCTVGTLTEAYDASGAPGVAEVALRVRPTSGVVTLFGGTTGCVGSAADCSSWSQEEALDGSGGSSVALANADVLMSVSGATVTDAGTVHAGVLAETVCPSDTTYGRRGAAGATTDAAWSHDDQNFSSGGDFVIVGGTRHQDLGVGVQHVLTCADSSGQDMLICSDFCAALASSWGEGDPAFANASDGLVTDWDVVGVLDDATAGWDLQGNPGERMYAGATWFGDAQVLIWGGEGDGTVRSDLLVWDTTAADRTYYSATEPWGARVGGSAIYDPVSRTAYLYGGAADDTVYTYALDDLPAEENVIRSEGDQTAGVWTPSVAAALSSTDGANWTLWGAYELGIECIAGESCWAEDLEFLVATQSPTELESLVVHVTYGHGDDYDLTAYEAENAGRGFSRLRVRLPRIATEGYGLDVEVSWEGEPLLVGSFDECDRNTRVLTALCEYPVGEDDAATTADDRATLTTIGVQPVFPASLDSAPIALSTSFSLPTGWQGIAPGAPDSGGTTFTGLDNLDPYGRDPYQNRLFAVEGLALQDTLTTGASNVYVWLDAGVDTGASTYGSYLTATSGDARLQADVDWLEANIAPLTDWPINVILVRRSEAEQAAAAAGTDPPSGGESNSGLITVFGVDAAGVPLLSLRRLVVHELAHQALQLDNQPFGLHNKRTWWLAEGAPTLVSWLRLGSEPAFRWAGNPSVQLGMDMPFHAASALAEDACLGLGDLEAGGAVARVRYHYGAYTLAQMQMSFMAHGGTAASFWSELESFETGTELVDPGEVRDFITSSLGLPAFYDEWVKYRRVGTPLLAVTAVEGDVAGCLDTGDCAPLTATARVEQVQFTQLRIDKGCLADAPVFTDVPFYLSCTAAGGDALAFTECDATRAGLLSVAPQMTSAASLDVSLTVDAALGGASPWPADVRLLANDALLQGWIPQAGYRLAGAYSRVRDFRICPRPDDAACGGDGDGDGFPLLSECDDADATWNPVAVPLPFTAESSDDDNNCDGW